LEHGETATNMDAELNASVEHWATRWWCCRAEECI
jgi:hypothetical protein